VVPGIVETHVHPISAAISEIDGPVPVVHSIVELEAYIRAQDKKLPPGRLIFVPKVYSTRLTDHRYTTRYELDEAAPTREVVADTSIIDRYEGPDGFRAYQTLYESGELTARSYVTYGIQAQGTPAQVRAEIERIPFVTGSGDNWLRVGNLKTIVDGGILIGTA